LAFLRIINSLCMRYLIYLCISSKTQYQTKKLSFKHKQRFKLLSKNKTGSFNVKYIQHRDGSVRLAGIDHMIFSN
jgi:hypothetical protein